jgi:hypothetical protein
MLLTGFPSAAERAEIVLALARAMPLGDGATDALHSGAAADTAALLTGADLQVCSDGYTAQSHCIVCVWVTQLQLHKSTELQCCSCSRWHAYNPDCADQCSVEVVAPLPVRRACAV